MPYESYSDMSIHSQCVRMEGSSNNAINTGLSKTNASENIDQLLGSIFSGI